MQNPYKTLDVPVDATDKEIKQAHRDKCKQAHPDKGGTASLFQKVQSAYVVLRDPKRRRKYDKDKTLDDGPDNEQGEVLGMCTSVYVQALAHIQDFEHDDIIEKCKQALTLDIREWVEKLASIKAQFDKIEGVIKRTTHKKGVDFIGGTLRQAKASLKKERIDTEDLLEITRKALVLFEEGYVYKTDPSIQERRYPVNASCTTPTGIWYQKP